MNEQDRALVDEIVGAFVTKGLVPKRRELGNATESCAVGSLLTAKDRDEGNYEEFERMMAARFGGHATDYSWMTSGVISGFDGFSLLECSIPEEVYRLNLFHRGYAIGAEVWRILHAAPKETVPSKEIVKCT